MIVRSATRDDDSAIVELMERVAMPGSMRLAFGCRPSFFQALRVEGNTPLVAVAEVDGKIVGVGAVTFRQVYLNGRVATARYLSALRIAPEARGAAALARGFARLRSELAQHPADITLTSILSNNTSAAAILTSGRAGLPAYHELCDCVTRVVAAGKPEHLKPPDGLRIDQGASVGEIAGFLATHGPARNFFPVCLAEDLDGRADSAFPGLSGHDFLVASDASGIRGVMGCWDVRRFRQALVSGYAAWLGWARPWLNLRARCCGRPLLPAPGETLGLAFAALTVLRDGDPRVLRSLLDSARAWARRRGLGYFVMAMAANDPLEAGFRGLAQREIHSRMYRVEFDPSSIGTVADRRTCHFEGAML